MLILESKNAIINSIIYMYQDRDFFLVKQEKGLSQNSLEHFDL